MTAFHYRKSDQPAGLDFYTLRTKGKGRPLVCGNLADATAGGIALAHRAELQRILIKHLPHAPRCSKRLQSYKETSSGIQLFFADGTTAVCDVLIGADGIRSAVRHGLLLQEAQNAPPEVADELRSCIEPSWTGVICYRTVVPAARLAARSPHHRALHLPMQVSGILSLSIVPCSFLLPRVHGSL